MEFVAILQKRWDPSLRNPSVCQKLKEHTIRTSWITPHHFIVRELISVIIATPITPNNVWGFNKRNAQEKLHLLVLSLLGRSTPLITPKYSQIINWRNAFHLGYNRKFLGN